jgi:putative SOS response-associated peptidase YedK
VGRLAVVLPEDAWARWLDPTPSDPGELLGLLQPTDEVALRTYAVERLVNDVRQDGPALLVPLAVEPSTAEPDAATLGL